MKRKSHGRRDAENFPRNETIKPQLACQQALYFGGVVRSHGMRGAFARYKWRACCQAKLQQLSCVLFIFMTISFDCGTLTHFAVYKLY